MNLAHAKMNLIFQIMKDQTKIKLKKRQRTFQILLKEEGYFLFLIKRMKYKINYPIQK